MQINSPRSNVSHDYPRQWNARFHLRAHPPIGHAEGRQGCESFWSLRVRVHYRRYLSVARRKAASVRYRAIGIRRRKLTSVIMTPWAEHDHHKSPITGYAGFISVFPRLSLFFFFFIFRRRHSQWESAKPTLM